MSNSAFASTAFAACAPQLLQSTTDFLMRHARTQRESILAGDDGLSVAHERAKALDGLLASLFAAGRAAALSTGLDQEGFADASCALLATGSYGRRQLALKSDVDIMLLLPQTAKGEAERIFTDLFLYPLWDAGLEVGHALLSEQELLRLAQSDLRTATALLDARFVCGSRKAADSLREAVFARYRESANSTEALLRALQEECHTRHQRFGDSTFLLEPEIKLARGGLRDADVAMWAARVRWGASSLEELAAAGGLRSHEVPPLEAAMRFLWSLRQRLHANARQRNNRLTFEDQEELGVQLGLGEERVEAAERLMHDYYRHARRIAETTERLLSRSLAATSKAGPTTSLELAGLRLWNDGEGLRCPESEELQLSTAFLEALVLHTKRDAVRWSPSLRDALARFFAGPLREHPTQHLREEASVRRLLRELLCGFSGAQLARGSLLREVHDLGLLETLFPEFEALIGRVQFDVYHTYTVDEHSVRAADWLARLCAGQFGERLPAATQLAAAFKDDLVLALATLLHDVGKTHGREHPEVGARLAEKMVPDWGMNAADGEALAWLVRHHLALYHWATRRDHSDPSTRDEVRERVPSLLQWDRLYLLTLADLSTTSAKALTPWKLEMLTHLHGALRSEWQANETGARPEAPRLPESLQNWFESCRAQAQGATQGLVTRDRPADALAEVLLWAPNRRGLLADVALVVSEAGGEIVTARCWIDAELSAVDLFTLRHRSGESWDASALESLARHLRDRALEPGMRGLSLQASQRLERVRRLQSEVELPWKRRHVPPVRSRVSVSAARSEHAWVVEVITADRPGLLVQLADAIEQLGLEVSFARVATEGHKAADTFYVQAPGALKPDATMMRRLESELRGLL